MAFPRAPYQSFVLKRKYGPKAGALSSFCLDPDADAVAHNQDASDCAHGEVSKAKRFYEHDEEDHFSVSNLTKVSSHA